MRLIHSIRKVGCAVTALCGVAAFFISIQPAHALAPFSGTFAAPAPTSTVGTIRHVRVDPSDGTVYVLGSSTSTLGAITADGSSFSSITYSPAQLLSVGSDFVVSDGKVFIITTNGANGRTYRYDVSGTTANLVASLNGSGTGAITFADSNLYTSRSTAVVLYDTLLTKLSPTSTASFAITKLGYGGGQLYYLSSAGRVVRTNLDGSDVTLSTSGPTVNAKGLAISSDGSALYVANGTGGTLTKMLGSDGSVLWTKNISNLAGMDINTSTGEIFVIDSSGTVTVYDPINAVSSFAASASSSNAILIWTAGVDGDTRGVTIRRSTSGFPATPSDGTAVTSSATVSNFTDSGLADGTYYYAIFNQTIDGYYGAGVTTSLTIDVPPDPVSSFIASASGTTASLNWTNPTSPDFSHVSIRRSTTDFPASLSDGFAVSSTVIGTSFTETGLSDNVYYYGLFAIDSGNNASIVATSSVTIDTTPPVAPILTAYASGTTINLTWDVPVGTASFLLRRSMSAPPSSISDGSAVTSTGASTISLVQAGLAEGAYYYGIFAADAYGNYSNAGTVGVLVDVTGPATPTGFIAASSGSTVGLTWSNPIDADFASVTIRRSTVAYPTSTTAGTAVTTTALTSFSDVGLTDGTYYYSIFAADQAGNISNAATSSATVDTFVPSGNGSAIVIVPAAPVASFGSSPAPALVLGAVPRSADTSSNISISQNSVSVIATRNSSVSLRINTPSLFKRNLQLGSRGDDVKSLQQFLNSRGFIVAPVGAGSPGNETTFFGPATARALGKFQEANAEQILLPLGLTKGTGILGTATMKVLNLML